MANHSRKRKRRSDGDQRDDNAGLFSALQEQDPELGLLNLEEYDAEFELHDPPESDESDAFAQYTDSDNNASMPGDADDEDEEQGNDTGAHNGDGHEKSFSTGCIELSKAYQESDEDLPDSPIFDPDVADISNGCKGIAADIFDYLETIQCTQSGPISNYKAGATIVASGYRSEPVVIGLFGKTGSGKSETVNSILDKPGLAKAVAAGEACTAVAIEYTAALPGQAKPFKAKVHFFNADKRAALLQEQIETYFFYLSVKPKQGQHAKDKELEKAWRPRHSTAIKTFRALFCGSLDFRSIRSTEKYLKIRGPKASRAIHRDMVSWCERLLQSRSPETHNFDKDYVECYEAGSIQSLRRAIDPFTTSNTAYRNPALWPLVDRVSIACKGSRVLESAIIADLPGVTDTNRVRVQAARRYILQCDYLVIVADINRICDDSTVAGLLDEYADRFRDEIIVVATKSDTDITPALVDHFKARKSGMKGYYSLEIESQHKSNEMIELVKLADIDKTTEGVELAGIHKSLEGFARERPEDLLHLAAKLAEKSGKLQERAKLEEQMTKLQKQIDDIAMRKFSFMVDLRNRKIESQVRLNTAAYSQSGEGLPIFSISNTHYAAAKGCVKLIGPCLSPGGTGVPRLRTHLLRLTAVNRTKAFKRHLEYNFGALTRSLLVWTAGGEVRSAGHIRAQIKQLKRKLSEIVDTKPSNIAELVNVKILTPLHDRHNQDHISKETPDIITGLQAKGWRWNTIKSFVRCRGKNENSVKSGIDWNKDFSRTATSELILPVWKYMRQKFDIELFDLEREFRHELMDIGSALYTEPDAQHLPLGNCVRLLELITKDLLSKIQKYVEENNKKILNVQLQAVVQAEYFAQAMEPIYTACEDIRGRGVKMRILNKISNHVLCKGARSPFAVLGTKIANEINLCFQEFADQTKQAIDGAVKQIEENCENMIVDQATADGDQAYRAQVREFLVKERVEERYLALLAKRDAVFAKPEYANAAVKLEKILE